MARLMNIAAVAIPPAERRDTQRCEVAMWGRIRLRNGDAHPARFCNLSEGGFMVMTPATIKKYSEIDVEIPVIGWRTAVVAWVDGDKMGGEFEPRLHPAIVERLIQFRGE
jgi:hypothetical protein